MQRGYFKTAWSDITQSPHWVTRILLLALLSFIPVFGWIVIAGYLWGWARDMAWGVHAPLPERIFENADGTLYSRGFFAAVIAVVCAVAMSVLQSAGGLISSGSFAGSAFVSTRFTRRLRPSAWCRGFCRCSRLPCCARFRSSSPCSSGSARCGCRFTDASLRASRFREFGR